MHHKFIFNTLNLSILDAFSDNFHHSLGSSGMYFDVFGRSTYQDAFFSPSGKLQPSNFAPKDASALLMNVNPHYHQPLK